MWRRLLLPSTIFTLVPAITLLCSALVCFADFMACPCEDAPTLSHVKRLSGELRCARVLCCQHDEGVLQRGAP